MRLLWIRNRKLRKESTPEARQYRKLLMIRKLLMYAVLLISFVLVLLNNIDTYSDSYNDRLKPQISRAVIQVARIIPQLKNSEAGLRKVCDQMNSSWDRLTADRLLDESDYDIPDTKAKLEQFIGETLSWMDRVTKLKVGRDGRVVVLDKNTMQIIASSDTDLLGVQLDPKQRLTEDNVLSLNDIKSVKRADELTAKFNLFEVHNAKWYALWRPSDIGNYLFGSLYGCIIEHEDYYIICGISFAERFVF